MRCSITLTIISAVTLTVAQLKISTKDSIQYGFNKAQLRSRDSDHLYTLQPRSPVPGSSHSKPQNRRTQDPNEIYTREGWVSRQPFAWIRNEPDRAASISRLEKKYAMKNMGLPPLRHTQSAPGLDRHGNPWSTLRSRRDPAHTMSAGRAAAFEMADGPSSSGPQLLSSPRPKFQSGPAEMMVKYDVLQKRPGEPGYVPPSPFRASRVAERSMISIPDRKPPRTRESGVSALGTVKNEKVKTGCLGCFGK